MQLADVKKRQAAGRNAGSGLLPLVKILQKQPKLQARGVFSGSFLLLQMFQDAQHNHGVIRQLGDRSQPFSSG